MRSLTLAGVSVVWPFHMCESRITVRAFPHAALMAQSGIEGSRKGIATRCSDN